MDIYRLLILVAAALLIGWLGRGRARGWALLVASVLGIYWLQPATPVRNLDFWLPTAALALAVWVWAATRPAPGWPARPDLLTGGVLAGLVLLIALNRYVEPLCCLTPTRPPALPLALAGLALIALLVMGLQRGLAGRTGLLAGLTLFILALFIILKTPALAELASAGLRAMGGQKPELASALDLRWLGFSYLAFRLIHTLRDRASGKLGELTLQEFIIYLLFFPAFSAGPIDRVQRFTQDLRQPFVLNAAALGQGGQRLVWGLFKKFALADSLALVALNATNAAQATSTPWLWVLLYAYAFRLYADFSGYTDIAIGLGQLMGFKLPENFAQPYLKPNLTTFWNSWHITLAQWFRAYYFNPLTRALRTRSWSMPLIILLGQVSTMLLIGLWHGVSWSFAAWGLWHGLGMFIHNRWVEAARTEGWLARRLAVLETRPRLKRAAVIAGTLLTFHYVTLGWVWFALPEIGLAGRVFLKLLGIQV
jgi:alginate O-acetyltransferase complex protein AlgI